ncbi:hypothetical protein VTN77DRAFT_1734 [Rasamsonia byssochlamydoides]|uniref:uncharacterized protein n=1 Tax=Rasamsonia byssochlamydoides TaxID=89139 RepID=UPI00374449AA
MASSNGYNNPDLSAVLKTLSKFAPPSTAAPSSTTPSQTFNSNVTSHFHHPQSADAPQKDEDEYEPSDVINQPQPQPQHSQFPQTIPSASTAATSNRASGNTNDPSTITTWPAALKHVMRAVAQNEALQSRIRRLIRSQHEHEKQWWQGREALIAKQKARVEKKKQLDEVLRSVGAPVTPSSSKEGSTEKKENEAELKHYDAKVYKASVDMSKAMESELRNLGIPFFAIKPSLIAPEDKKKDRADELRSSDPLLLGAASASASAPTTAERKETTTMISKVELLTLQRRMLELLQDLCKD